MRNLTPRFRHGDQDALSRHNYIIRMFFHDFHDKLLNSLHHTEEKPGVWALYYISNRACLGARSQSGNFE